MKSLRIFAVLTVLICLMGSCATSRKSSDEENNKRKTTVTGVTPNVKNPSRGVLNASGDGLTPGIRETNGAGSEENAANIVNNAIVRANTGIKTSQQKLDSISDIDFLNKGAASDMKEITLSRNAQKTTPNAKIKDYAAMILNDHEQLLKEIKKLAADHGADLPSDDKLYAMNGTDITDFEYVDMMIEDHKNAIRIYTAASKSKDPLIREFALKYLPLLQKHLSAAQELTKEVRPKR